MLYIQEVSKPGEKIMKRLKELGVSFSSLADGACMDRNLFRYQVCHVKHHALAVLAATLRARAGKMWAFAAELELQAKNENYRKNEFD